MRWHTLAGQWYPDLPGSGDSRIKKHALMRSKPAVPPALPPDAWDTPFESERDQICQNIEAILEFYTREEQKFSGSQRILERISRFIG